MSEGNMQFPIPNSVLEPYIKSAVASAITAALGDGAQLVEKAVQQALMAKVSHDGSVSRYDGDNRFLLVEAVARTKIQEVARQTINELAEELRPKIREQIEKQLRNQHAKLAQALLDGLIGSLKSSWSVRVDIDTTKN